MKIYCLFMEPANYTLDAIRQVYSQIGADYAFVYRFSAANVDTDVKMPVLSEMAFIKRIKYAWSVLRSHDSFIINGYVNPNCLIFIFLNILFFKKPYAIDSDTELQIPASRLKRLAKRVFLKCVFGRTYAYGFAGGHFEHRKAFTYYGMADEHVFVNGMMIDNAKYERVVVPDPGEKFHFGYLGRLVPLKQVDCVIRAIMTLESEGLPVVLDIVGTGEAEEGLRQLAGGSRAIRFLGAKFGEEKISALHRFDALVLYSNYESWGLVVNEALAAGIPCVVSNRVGARNDLVLGEEPAGIVVPYDDQVALVVAFRSLSQDISRWRRYSRAARKRMSLWTYELQREAIRRFSNG